jgi:hypothetical protein
METNQVPRLWMTRKVSYVCVLWGVGTWKSENPPMDYPTNFSSADASEKEVPDRPHGASGRVGRAVKKRNHRCINMLTKEAVEKGSWYRARV